MVSKHLMRTAGVADVVSFGGFQKEYHVLADPGRLRQSGLTLKDLVDAVTESNGATSGGYVEHGESELVVRGRGYLRSPRDIENTVVRAIGGTPVLVRNVAQVVEAYTPRAARWPGAGRWIRSRGRCCCAGARTPRTCLPPFTRRSNGSTRRSCRRG